MICLEEGLNFALEALVSCGLSLHLFSNNITPHANYGQERFVEVTGGGYGPISLSGWVITAHRATHPEQTFHFTEPVGKVYGSYLLVSDARRIICAERFADGPYDIKVSGSKITVPVILISKGE